MSDYRPTEQQLLESINERLKKTNDHLDWIKYIMISLTIALAVYFWDHK